jgi:hypothetical protein
MARLQFFESDIKVAIRNDLSREEIGRELAAFAKADMRAYLASLPARPHVRTFINGREGVREEAVIAPGPIVYELDFRIEVALLGLRTLRRDSPVRSGKYRRSHFVMVGGQEVTESALESGRVVLHPASEIIITNDQPYHRKVHVGASGFRAYRHLYERARQVILRRFGQIVRVDIRFIDLSGPPAIGGAPVPWVLKTHGRRRRAAQDARSSAFRAGLQFLAGRTDTAAGQQVRYPALVINLRQ